MVALSGFNFVLNVYTVHMWKQVGRNALGLFLIISGYIKTMKHKISSTSFLSRKTCFYLDHVKGNWSILCTGCVPHLKQPVTALLNAKDKQQQSAALTTAYILLFDFADAIILFPWWPVVIVHRFQQFWRNSILSAKRLHL